MLAAMEDLLDGWPGTLLVVSHDRYLVERVTDQQYAVIDGAFRHLPGGIDEYLRLRRERSAAPTAASGSAPASAPAVPVLSGAALRTAEKELASIDRRLAKLAGQVAEHHESIARHDQSDYVGLGRLTEELRALEGQIADQETRWLELSEQLEG